MNQFYLVAGLGKTGHSIAAYLQRRNLPFVAFDTRKKVDNLAEFNEKFPGVDVFLEELPDNLYNNLKEIITSPGISLDEPFLKKAASLAIPIVGDIECFARSVHAPIIAITGTNGKSTVTTLVGEMAKAAGKKVAVAGNIGLPVLDLVDDSEHYDLWVLELSSFQLDLTYSLAPIAACILNISPDHLDRHHTLEAYIASKQTIYRQAKHIIYNRDDSVTFPALILEPDSDCTLSSFGLDSPANQNEWGMVNKENGEFLSCGDNLLIDVDQLLIKGKHNWQNALAAAALASSVKIAPIHIKSVLTSFAGLAHRCQWVRTLNEVDWINDSKGTNIGATISAVAGIGESIKGKIVLIAGGLGKGADFSQLRSFAEKYTRSIILIGKDAINIEHALAGCIPTLMAASFAEAITIANEQARPGDVVLLSPACASQDMFKDFNHRGEVFVQLVSKL